MSKKTRLLILSAVYPFPRNSGQQQRVYYKLRALRADFHITFLTIFYKLFARFRNQLATFLY